MNEDIYIDQCRVVKSFLYASYTPHGIRNLDTAFCKRILKAATANELREIEADLHDNPHLHIKIKENLILNLNTRWEQLYENKI